MRWKWMCGIGSFSNFLFIFSEIIFDYMGSNASPSSSPTWKRRVTAWYQSDVWYISNSFVFLRDKWYSNHVWCLNKWWWCVFAAASNLKFPDDATTFMWRFSSAVHIINFTIIHSNAANDAGAREDSFLLF